MWLILKQTSVGLSQSLYTHFRVRNLLYFHINFLDGCSRGYNFQLTLTGSGNGLVPNRWQVINWMYDESVHWLIALHVPDNFHLLGVVRIFLTTVKPLMIQLPALVQMGVFRTNRQAIGQWNRLRKAIGSHLQSRYGGEKNCECNIQTDQIWFCFLS